MTASFVNSAQAKEGVGTFRFIPLSVVDRAMALGWSPTPALQGTPHGFYSVLCEWLCDCPEAWPIRSSR